jgi:hypothetical protein
MAVIMSSSKRTGSGSPQRRQRNLPSTWECGSKAISALQKGQETMKALRVKLNRRARHSGEESSTSYPL